MKKEHYRTTGEALGTLIIARIFDFIFITIFFLLLIGFIGDLTPDFMALVIIGIVFLLLSTVFLIGLVYCGDVILINFKKVFITFNFDITRLGSYLSKKCDETVSCINVYKAKKDRHLPVLLLSLAIWSFSYLLFYLIALSMHINLGLIPILFASSFAVFSTVLPIQGIGGFGTMEGGWALGFIAVGVTKEIAISTGFGFHLIILVYTLFFGGTGYLKISLSRKQKNS
jgi:uncharacterized protein (TIRG00374 family)